MTPATCRPAAQGARRRLRLRTVGLGGVELQFASCALRAGRRALLRAVRRGPEELVFGVAALTVGCHRFLFDFTYAGRTHTASFTQEVPA